MYTDTFEQPAHVPFQLVIDHLNLIQSSRHVQNKCSIQMSPERIQTSISHRLGSHLLTKLVDRLVIGTQSFIRDMKNVLESCVIIVFARVYIHWGRSWQYWRSRPQQRRQRRYATYAVTSITSQYGRRFYNYKSVISCLFLYRSAEKPSHWQQKHRIMLESMSCKFQMRHDILGSRLHKNCPVFNRT